MMVAQVGARNHALSIILLLLALGLFVPGSRWFIDSAVVSARLLAISELMIGLTIVAAGMSMPEVATSIMAAIRRGRDIAVGNVVQRQMKCEEEDWCLNREWTEYTRIAAVIPCGFISNDAIKRRGL